MCVETYVACEHCGARAEESVEMIEIYSRSERCRQSLDEDGDPVGDHEYDDAYGDSELVESFMECSACSNTGGDILDHEHSSDYCECGECNPEIDNYVDGDALCALVRRFDVFPVPEREDDWPPEIEKLLTNRLIHFIPVTRARAEEIADEVSDVFSIDLAPSSSDPFCVDLAVDITPRAIEQLSVDHVADTNARLQLSIPNEREEVADVAV